MRARERLSSVIRTHLIDRDAQKRDELLPLRAPPLLIRARLRMDGRLDENELVRKPEPMRPCTFAQREENLPRARAMLGLEHGAPSDPAFDIGAMPRAVDNRLL